MLSSRVRTWKPRYSDNRRSQITIRCMQTIDTWHKQLLCFCDAHLLQRNQRRLRNYNVRELRGEYTLQLYLRTIDSLAAPASDSMRTGRSYCTIRLQHKINRKGVEWVFCETGSSVMDEPSTIHWLSIVGYFASPLFFFLFLMPGHYINSSVAEE